MAQEGAQIRLSPITCWVLMSTPDSQQPKPGWLWYQPTTISGLRACRADQRTARGVLQEAGRAISAAGLRWASPHKPAAV